MHHEILGHDGTVLTILGLASLDDETSGWKGKIVREVIVEGIYIPMFLEQRERYKLPAVN